MRPVAMISGACLLLAAVVVWRLIPATEPNPAPADPKTPAGPAAASTVPAAAPPMAERPPDPAAPLAATAAPDAPARASGQVAWAADAAVADAERRLRLAAAELEANPHNVAALRDRLAACRALERWNDAAAALDQLRLVEPGNAEYTFERAGLLLRERRWIEAAELYREVTRQQPERAAAWFNLGVAQQAARRLNDARTAWDRAIALRPDDPQARLHRAEVLLDLHEWTTAATDLSLVVAARPDDADSALNLALALNAAGDTYAALQALNRALEARPRDVRLLNRAAELAWTLYADGRDSSGRQRDVAIGYLRRSLGVDASQADVARRLAEIER